MPARPSAPSTGPSSRSSTSPSQPALANPRLWIAVLVAATILGLLLLGWTQSWFGLGQGTYAKAVPHVAGSAGGAEDPADPSHSHVGRKRNHMEGD